MAERHEGVGDEARPRDRRVFVGVGVGELLEIFERAIVVAGDAVAVGIHAAELPEREAVAVLGGILQRHHGALLLAGLERLGGAAHRIDRRHRPATAPPAAATACRRATGVGSIPKASAITAALARTLNIRIARLLGGPARMGDGAMQRIADLLGVFPDVTGRRR